MTYVMDHNGKQSPLLRLPHDIIHMILRLLLGNNLIHIKYRITPTQHGTHYCLRLQVPMPGKLMHSLCIAPISEDAAYKAFCSGDESVLCDTPELSWRSRHEECGFWNEQSLFQNATFIPSRWKSACHFDEFHDEGHPKIDLSVLRTCRRLHMDGTDVLWRTNTFSFEDPLSFEKFMISLTAMQKNAITTLHIRIIWAVHTFGWKRVATARLWRKLRSLRIVHLDFFQNLGNSSTGFGLQGVDEQAQQQDVLDKFGIIIKPDYFLMEPFHSLQCVPLSHVTVTIMDNRTRVSTCSSIPEKLLWSPQEQRDAAERLRTKLLNSCGRRVWKARIKSESREEKARKDARECIDEHSLLSRHIEALNLQDEEKNTEMQAIVQEKARRKQEKTARRQARREERHLLFTESDARERALESNPWWNNEPQ
ncbi:hypothetical protein ACLMJK_008770 [Lecanora helva]